MPLGPKTHRHRPIERRHAAIGYIRVSTDAQAESGAGLSAQRSTIEAEAVHRALPLDRIYQDAGVSAKSMDKRPALTEALRVLTDGEASVLIVAKLDRLSRSIGDFAGLVRVAERQGWAILACDLGVDMTSPTGGLLANVTASVAEWERKIISARTKDALAAKRAAGVRLGRPRLLVEAVAERIRKERASGDTLQEVADRLNDEDLLTPTGRLWSPALVRKVAIRPASTF